MGSGPCYERISALDHATMPQTDNPREKRLQNNKKDLNLRHSAWFPQNGN
jgi:hypothetical protein